MKLGKLKNAQLSKQSHEIGFVQRVQSNLYLRDLQKIVEIFLKSLLFL
jgi:hypothetical protein